LDVATSVRERAHVPVSGYKVGAALLTNADVIYTGINVETHIHTPCVHAEVAALTHYYKYRAGPYEKIIALAVVCDGNYYPCGLCRQVLWEHCDADLRIITRAGTTTLGSLLPEPFRKKS
jgi:cytidine deaminase